MGFSIYLRVKGSTGDITKARHPGHYRDPNTHENTYKKIVDI